MFRIVSRRLALLSCLVALAASVADVVVAQEDPAAPVLNSYAPTSNGKPMASSREGRITLTAQLTEDGPDVTRGLIWRVFRPDAGPDGKLPLVATAQGGTSRFDLEPGSYLVHASFGRAGATKRITVSRDPKLESLVLDAGGLKLDAATSDGARIPPDQLKFSIFEAEEESNGDRALILPDVKPNAVVRLNAGTYHVVSTYGGVNAVIRSDIKVEAGKLTEASVEHKAAHMTLKLVREKGGEALADTSWSIYTGSGDLVRESVGAYSSMVLAEGDYTIIAKNRERIYQRDFTVEAGRNLEVEVLTTQDEQVVPAEADFAD